MARVLKHCEVVGECWVWSGALSYSGQPRFNVSGRIVSVVRVLIGFGRGKVIAEDERIVMRSTCPKTCVNPDHARVLSTSAMRSESHRRTKLRHNRPQKLVSSVFDWGKD